MKTLHSITPKVPTVILMAARGLLYDFPQFTFRHNGKRTLFFKAPTDAFWQKLQNPYYWADRGKKRNPDAHVVFLP